MSMARSITVYKQASLFHSSLLEEMVRISSINGTLVCRLIFMDCRCIHLIIVFYNTRTGAWGLSDVPGSLNCR